MLIYKKITQNYTFCCLWFCSKLSLGQLIQHKNWVKYGSCTTKRTPNHSKRAQIFDFLWKSKSLKYPTTKYATKMMIYTTQKNMYGTL